MSASASTRAPSPRTDAKRSRGGRGASRGSQSVERKGEIKALRRCDPEGRDGTKLPACFNVYMPAPNGKFGMVLRFIRDDEGLAFAISPSASGTIPRLKRAHRLRDRSSASSRLVIACPLSRSLNWPSLVPPGVGRPSGSRNLHVPRSATGQSGQPVDDLSIGRYPRVGNSGAGQSILLQIASIT
jgi:hypothetical protein